MKRFEKGFILYGAGKTGKVLADEIEASNSNGIQLEAFIDKNLSGTYRKTPIFQIEKVPNSYKSLPVVISIHNPDVNLREIEEKLVAEGWDSSNIIRLPEFYLMMKTQ